MQGRIEKYFNLMNVALIDLDCEKACLEELSKTIEYLSDVARLKRDVDKAFADAKRKLETFMSMKSDLVRKNFKTKGITYSERMVEDLVIHIHTEEYTRLRTVHEDAKSDYELVSNLLMIMYTRRDLIKEMINFYRFKVEKTECLMMNKKFMQFVENAMENTT